MQNKFSKSIICPARGLETLTPFIFTLTLPLWCPYFSTGCCSPAELPPMVRWKKLINPELSCHERTDSIPNASLQEDKMCVKKYHHLAGIAEPRYAGSMCEGAFVSLISLMLLCVSHCSPWMSVTFCCPVKGNQHLE